MEDDWLCSICLIGKDERVVVAHECKKHWFHKECLEAAATRSSKCPMCRFTSAKPRILVKIFCPIHLQYEWYDMSEYMASMIPIVDMVTDVINVE